MRCRVALKRAIVDLEHFYRVINGCICPYGDGLDTLVETLIVYWPSRDASRCSVHRDRSFLGGCTVVTGTVWSWPGIHGETVTVLPSGHTARVRDERGRSLKIQRMRAGWRTALNLPGRYRPNLSGSHRRHGTCAVVVHGGCALRALSGCTGARGRRTDTISVGYRRVFGTYLLCGRCDLFGTQGGDMGANSSGNPHPMSALRQLHFAARISDGHLGWRRNCRSLGEKDEA